ncbi:hypothetical protein, partial [Pseudomonas syringae group genomosp. 7]|uniref:hypothetical protein n=1 Tax=Pseudomonas syringae group genomosp. 7 TaxID=251699 RepID=UPI00376F5900
VLHTLDKNSRTPLQAAAFAREGACEALLRLAMRASGTAVGAPASVPAPVDVDAATLADLATASAPRVVALRFAVAASGRDKGSALEA